MENVTQPSPSEALKRVRNFNPFLDSTKPRYDGLFLSLSQLKELVKRLKKGDAGIQAKGFAFMIGEYTGSDGNEKFTVEVIPYTINSDEKRDFFVNEMLTNKIALGNLEIDLGLLKDVPPDPFDRSFVLSNSKYLPIEEVEGVAQKTPSPPAI